MQSAETSHSDATT